MKEAYRIYIREAKKEGKSLSYIISRLKNKVSKDNVVRYYRRIK